MPTDKPAYPSDGAEKFVVRFPDGMRDRIADEAKKNNRSMNAEIVSRLQASFDPLAISDEALSAAFLSKIDPSFREIVTTMASINERSVLDECVARASRDLSRIKRDSHSQGLAAFDRDMLSAFFSVFRTMLTHAPDAPRVADALHRLELLMDERLPRPTTQTGNHQ